MADRVEEDVGETGERAAADQGQVDSATDDPSIANECGAGDSGGQDATMLPRPVPHDRGPTDCSRHGPAQNRWCITHKAGGRRRNALWCDPST